MPGVAVSSFHKLKSNVVNIIFYNITSKLDEVMRESLYTLWLRDYFEDKNNYYDVVDSLYSIFLSAKTSFFHVIKNMFQKNWPTDHEFSSKLTAIWRSIEMQIFHTICHQIKEPRLYYQLFYCSRRDSTLHNM